MALLSNYKTLKASSLLESVIAITIISICLLIAIQIYATIFSKGSSILFFKAKMAEQQIINDTKLNFAFEDESFDYKTYRIDKKISTYKENTNLLLVKLSTIINKDTTHCSYIIPNNVNTVINE